MMWQVTWVFVRHVIETVFSGPGFKASLLRIRQARHVNCDQAKPGCEVSSIVPSSIDETIVNIL